MGVINKISRPGIISASTFPNGSVWPLHQDYGWEKKVHSFTLHVVVPTSLSNFSKPSEQMKVPILSSEILM